MAVLDGQRKELVVGKFPKEPTPLGAVLVLGQQRAFRHRVREHPYLATTREGYSGSQCVPSYNPFPTAVAHNTKQSVLV
jgi:hypothetical protein